MPLSIGDRLGQYEILGMLGQGGMGEVYRAKDTTLKRDVALKALPSVFLRDPERLARFQREAEVLASLDHPNIGPIYGMVESDGARALVLALIEGPTLEDRIQAGPAPQEEATAIARQIADALEYAHDRGVIHRDLKPANVKITPEGVVKVLDFGLAKVLEEEPSLTSLANSPTLTFGHTRAGVILGTAAYMSPEQAVGRPVDRRTDIFSFGVVLYELLTGKRAFDGATTPDVLEAVVKNDPDWSKLPTGTPGAIHRLLRRCLTKDRKQRLQAIGEARIALENPGAPEAPLKIESQQRSKPRWASASVALGIGAVCLAVGGVLAALLLPPAETDLSSYKFTPLSREEATERDPQWSPDGKSIAFTADIHGVLQVFTKGVGAHDAAQLTKSNELCALPFWSPDGSTIYYTTRGGGLWAVGASGGTPELVVEHAAAATIHPDGKTFAFVRERKLWVGPLKGEPPKEMGQALFPANAPIFEPKFSPDGSKLAVLDSGGSGLWLLPYPSGPPKRFGRGYGFGMSWLPDSRHLVLSDRAGGYSLSLLDVVDGSRRTIYSSPDALLRPSVSPDGKRIAYYSGATEWDVLEVSLPSGGVRAVVGGGGLSMAPDWAPSGSHFLFVTTRYGGFSIDDRSSKEGFTRRLFEAATGDTLTANVRWAPDGMRFVFTSRSSGGYKLMLSNSAGGRVIPVDRESDQSEAGAWSPDGQWIAYARLEAGKWQLAKIRPGSTAAPVVFTSTTLASGPNAIQIQWSPAGDWILYPTADGLSLISPDGNNERKLTTRRFPVWGFSKDGSQVLGVYQNTSPEGAEWQLYSVDVKTSAEKLIGAVDLPVSTNAIRSFSLNPDGKSFLTSIAKWPFDIWMLEGWDQQPTGLSRFFRRKAPPAPQSDSEP